MKYIIFVIAMFSSSLLFCQSKSYLIFVRENSQVLDISSVVYLQPLNHNIADQKQVLKLKDRLYIWQYLYFPLSSADLIGCCETGVNSWEKTEVIDLIEKLKEPKFDSLDNHYSALYFELQPSYNLFLEQTLRGWEILRDNFQIYIFSVSIDICECQYLRPDRTANFPIGYEAYLKKINKINKISREERLFFKSLFNTMISENPLKSIIDEIKSRKR